MGRKQSEVMQSNMTEKECVVVICHGWGQLRKGTFTPRENQALDAWNRVGREVCTVICTSAMYVSKKKQGKRFYV